MNTTFSYKTGEMTSRGEPTLTERSLPDWNWQEDYAFHRHCQKTVCSAFGTEAYAPTGGKTYGEGKGLTWFEISKLNLPNICKWVPRLDGAPSDLSEHWQQYFRRNTDNITEDLASILELIDKIAYNIAAPFRLKFIGKMGDVTYTICEKDINPWQDGIGTTYDIGNFGKDITLYIDEENVQFNTQFGPNEYRIALPKKDVKFLINGNARLRKTEDLIKVVADTNYTIDFLNDKNYIMAKDVPDGTKTVKFLEPATHVYYMNVTDDSTPLISVWMDIYNQNYMDFRGGDGKPNIVEYEVHFRNITSARRYLNVSSVGVSVEDWHGHALGGEVKTRTVHGLTDQLYIEPGMINAYVIRLHFPDNVYTYSLAYTYPINPN